MSNKRSPSKRSPIKKTSPLKKNAPLKLINPKQKTFNLFQVETNEIKEEKKEIIPFFQTLNDKKIAGNKKAGKKVVKNQIKIYQSDIPIEHIRQLSPPPHRKFKPYEPSACIEKSKLPLKDYQLPPVEFMRDHRGMIIWMGMGSGKTLVATTICQCHVSSYIKNNCIIVTSASLIGDFYATMQRYGVPEDDYEKYEVMSLQSFHSTFSKKTPNELKNICRHTALIVDEAHNIRTEIKSQNKSTYSDIVHKVSFYCAKIVLLSGTVMYNDVYDLANLAAIVKGEKVLSRLKFNQMIHDEESFNEYFKDLFYYYMDYQNKDYPSYTEYYAELTMTPKIFYEYHKLECGIVSSYERKKTKDPLKFYNELRKVSMKLSPCIKCNFVIDFIITFKQKSLIYSIYKDLGVYKMAEKLRKKGISCIVYSGDLNKTERMILIRDYNEGLYDVMLITKAGGEGLNLKGVKFVFFLESNWNRASESQIAYRAMRMGFSHSHLPEEERHVDIFHIMLVKPDINEQISSIQKYVYKDTDIDDYEEKLILDKELNEMSVDMLLKNESERKEKEVIEVEKRISALSIG